MRGLEWVAMPMSLSLPCSPAPPGYDRDDQEEFVADRAKRFQAVLEKGNRALGWTIPRVPFTLAELQAETGKPGPVSRRLWRGHANRSQLPEVRSWRRCGTPCPAPPPSSFRSGRSPRSAMRSRTKRLSGPNTPCWSAPSKNSATSVDRGAAGTISRPPRWPPSSFALPLDATSEGRCGRSR